MVKYSLHLIGCLLCLNVVQSVLWASSIEFKGGLSVSHFSAPNGMTTSSYSGLQAGVGLEIPLVPTLFLQPELTFAQRGVNIVDLNNIKITAKYDVLEIPLFVKAKFPGIARPYFLLGPKAQFNLSNGLETAAFKPRNTDFAVDAGIGLQLASLIAEIRYSVGITEFNDLSPDWRSRSLQFLLGVNI